MSTTTTTTPITSTTSTTFGRRRCFGTPMTLGQADIDANPNGTVFCISGTHNWTLTPKPGNQFIGDQLNPGVLDGQNSTTWAIYAFNINADNVVIQDLEIKNYRAESQRGAILASQDGASTGWILRNLQVHDNGTTSSGGAGVTVGPNWKILGGRYYNNRQIGLTGGGADGAIIDGVELDHNNFTNSSYTTANSNCGSEAGGFKWTLTNSITITNSSIHDNACKGLWADFNGDGAIITNNQIYNNWGEGVFFEISTGATITGNNVYNNGSHSDFGPTCAQFMWGGGITIAASDQVEIANNTVTNNCTGIGGVQQNRPDGTPGLLQNINVHDNTIVGPLGRSGWVTDNGANLAARNITWTNNTLSGGVTYCGFSCP